MRAGKTAETMLRGWHAGVFAAAMVVPAIVLALVGAIPQSAAYHAFADTRAWLGIPNAADVLSNLPFMVVGIVGLAQIRRRTAGYATLSWIAFFGGVFLVSIGSAYYHWVPDDARLVWDRLPMTLAFMGLFSALLVRHIGGAHERWLLPLALAAGLSSVAWWVASGDLRFYIWIQAAPFLAVTVLIVLFRNEYPNRRYLIYAIGTYIASKAMEYADAQFFEFSARLVSGHSVKHVLAAASVFCVLILVRDSARRRAEAS